MTGARHVTTAEELARAQQAARAGRGGKLAQIIKGVQTADLAYGLGRAGGDIGLALAIAIGRRSKGGGHE